jgi:D-lactate dehydrogenase
VPGNIRERFAVVLGREDTMPKTTVESLRSVELFANLESGVLEALAEKAERRHVKAGETLFREGDPADDLFVVGSGILEVRKQAESGAEVALRRMGPGEVGGLTSMAVAKVRSATLRAVSDVTVVTVARTRFLTLLEAYPSLVRAVMAFLSAKVRGKTYQLATLLEGRDSDTRPTVAVFDAKPYDRRYLDEAAGERLAMHYFETRLNAQTARLASGFDVVCAFVNDDLGRETMVRLAAEGVQLIALRCSGSNNVDVEAAMEHHLSVVRVPAYSPYAIAEHAVALILALNRKLHRAYNRVREGNFRLDGLVGFDLNTRTAGVIGLGAIGRTLARVLSGFGMRVLASDPYADPAAAEAAGAQLVQLNVLLTESDIISLHAPLTPETHHLLNAERLAMLRRGAMVINTSRGALIDTAALIEALKSGRVGAAGLDVYEEESGTFFEDLSDVVLSDDQLARLLTFPNVIVTSHQGFLTAEALVSIAETTVANIDAFLGGRRGADLPNVVLPSGD